MGKKKGKGKGQDEKWAGEDAPTLLEGMKEEEVVVDSNPMAAAGGRGAGGRKGKKDRKKKAFDEDWEDDLEAIAVESGTTVGEESGDKETAEKMEEEPEDSTEGGGGTKKGKKGRKEKDKDWEDELARDLEELGLTEGGEPDKLEKPAEPQASAKEPAKGGKKGKKKKKTEEWEDEIEALTREIEGGGATPAQPSAEPSKESEEKQETKPEGAVGGGNEQEDESNTVMTPAQKKAAKKEREKKKKEAAKKAKQLQSGEKEETVQEVEEQGEEVKDQSAEVKGQTLASGDVKEAETMEGAVGEGGEEEEGEEGEGDDKKKKKKKKKKAAEEEKKSKVKKPGKTVLLKMKEQIEAMRLEQKRREEEELARQRAEEEAERRHQEELHLEQERKEKRKQKELERKKRRKLEGKPVTKAERERHAKAMAQLEALKAQGIQIPARTEHQEGEKKKVRYGIRQRTKKPKQAQTAEGDQASSSETTSTVSDETVSTTSGFSEATGVNEQENESEEGVREFWDDEEEEEEGVKENWDENSGEEEEQEQVTESQPEPPKPVKPVQQAPPKQDLEEEEEEESESESSSESEESESEDLSPYDRAAKRIQERRRQFEEERSLDLLRSPVVCVLGHVDTGKTKILDKIRRTHVQDGEAGGITQQIGATFVPEEAIQEQTKMVKEFAKTEIKLPGLLIIDTPGHESFSNLRLRGSSMCDIAILVVDIMHGLEPQTLESIDILLKGKTPFIIALNKIDRMFDWRRNPNSGVRETLKKQKLNTREEFDERVKQVTTEFAEQGLNVALFWEKVNFKEYIPMVPTSAISGDGMGDLIALLVNYSQKTLAHQLMLSQELEAIVLEVKVIAGLGTTVDVILRNGILREGDSLVLTGTEGPFVTAVRALLMPQPLRELRVKNAYVNHKAIIASQGVKVCAKDLEKTLAGTAVFVAKKQDEVEVLKDEAAAAMKSALSAIQLQERGVFVQASTLGSLEALLGFLKQNKIPYAGVNIGPVHKKDVMKASVMLEHDSQWAVILAFDVRVEREAQEMADSLGVRIFTADIIYHLFDNFLKHRAELHERLRKEHEHIAVFPCKLRILPNCVFNSRDPIVVGVVVEAGLIKPGMPITIPSKNFCDIGVVSSMEMNHKHVELARKGDEVCVKIEAVGGEAPRLYGRHFDHTDILYSKITRDSIDAVKNYFREDLQKADWQLMIELKKVFHIL